MTHPDAELLLRLAAGEVEVFDRIVDRFERPLVRYFHALCGDPQLAEDCAQEVFVRLFKARERYTPDAAPNTFVFRIAKNLWIDVYRSKRARPEATSIDATSDDEDEDRASNLVGSSRSPIEAIGLAEDQQRLRAALLELPEGQRAVLALAIGQSMKYERIAEILGIPVGTVKSRVHAAVANLRKLLGVDVDADPKKGPGPA
ncbi:MAG: sigma-70 family RNA polymerase sigma factor [Planctomycetes bacterium]|nr:sigma-70 family RNA polymerase sigma factor [Planctomycetota bacterium]MCC7169728.1 sigma-70 family RNA polymerase sigma factor [Planctomycetota bacterium]